jgi:hypothetical protein
MKLIIMLSLALFSITGSAYVYDNHIHLVSEVVEGNLLKKTYVREIYTDKMQFCYEEIVVTFELDTKKLISSESRESCTDLK